MKNDDVKRAVAFAILEGILSKSPEYIIEKFERAMTVDITFVAQFLDGSNRAVFNQWLKRWAAEEREEANAYV